MNQQPNPFGPQLAVMRDPAIASYLSVIPGLGQIYNLEPRKGVLFFLVGLTNLIFIVALLASQQLVGVLSAASQEFNIAPNKDIANALESMHPGSPALMMLMLLFAAFIVYSMRDARDRARLVRRNEIYAPAVMQFSEATSGSYLLHAALMATLVLFAFFFLLPAPPRVQVTSIEFVNTVDQTKTPPKTPKVSDKDAKAQKDPTVKRVVRVPAPPKAESANKPAEKTPTKTEASKPAARAETPKQATPAKEAAKPAPPAPTQQKVSEPVARPILRPTMNQATPTAPNPLRQPAVSPARTMVAPMPSTQAPTADPSKLLSSLMPPAPVQRSNTVSQIPTPQSISVKSNGAPALIATNLPMSTTGSLPQPNLASPREGGRIGGVPQPKMIGTPGGPSRSGPSPSGPAARGDNRLAMVSPVGSDPTARDVGKDGRDKGGPRPSKIGTKDGDKDGDDKGDIGKFAAFRPNVGDSRPQIGSKDPAESGNPRDAKTIGTPQNPARAIDFGPYMADLQRRIKRAWVPPKAPSSKRVVMQFTIHTHGELSGLRLVRGSGSSDSDQAAMRAVQNAAPYRPLPDGAPPAVEVEFTFDYNVFSGSGAIR